MILLILFNKHVLNTCSYWTISQDHVYIYTYLKIPFIYTHPILDVMSYIIGL